MRAFLLSLITFFLIGGCHIFNPLNYHLEKGAPDVAIEERHTWGKKHLGVLYQRVVSWLENAEVVKENIGDVIAVAPVGRPNFLTYNLTDGLTGNFTLEVIGNKGNAIFAFSGKEPCSNRKACLNKGLLEVDGKYIRVNYLGVSQEKFE